MENNAEERALREELAQRERALEALKSEIARLHRQIEELSRSRKASGQLSPDEKIALFRKRFSGREDVFAVRWESAKTGKSGYQPYCLNEWTEPWCGKPKIKCSDCPNRKFAAVDNRFIRMHLIGRTPAGKSFVMGIYPLDSDDSCHFLAVDFDEGDFQDAARAFVKTCRAHEIEPLLERSRSGKGAHVWIFFSEKVPAWLARKLGAYLLTETMNAFPSLSFGCYDRFFPNQDSVPKGGFGNLIALPLQGEARARGNAVFVDDDFVPFSDPWECLTRVRELPLSRVNAMVADAQQRGEIFALQDVPAVLDSEEKSLRVPPRRMRPSAFPEKITLTLSNGIFIEKAALPPPLAASIRRLAAFPNPNYFFAQRIKWCRQ